MFNYILVSTKSLTQVARKKKVRTEHATQVNAKHTQLQFFTCIFLFGGEAVFNYRQTHLKG